MIEEDARKDNNIKNVKLRKVIRITLKADYWKWKSRFCWRAEQLNILNET